MCLFVCEGVIYNRVAASAQRVLQIQLDDANLQYIDRLTFDRNNCTGSYELDVFYTIPHHCYVDISCQIHMGMQLLVFCTKWRIRNLVLCFEKSLMAWYKLIVTFDDFI